MDKLYATLDSLNLVKKNFLLNENERIIHFTTPNKKIIYTKYKTGTKSMRDFVIFILQSVQFRFGYFVKENIFIDSK